MGATLAALLLALAWGCGEDQGSTEASNNASNNHANNHANNHTNNQSNNDAGNNQGVDAETDAETDADAPPGPTSLSLFDSARITSRQGEPNFHRVEAPVDLGPGPFARVVLVVDLGTTCYPFESWRDNPPPEGQNYPANCDAFDRNFEFTLDEPQTPDAPPAFELVRAITPFGGPLHLEVDLTDLANARPGAHRVTSHISTWSDGAGLISGSDGGWNVTARLDVTPGTPPRNVLGAVSLLNHNYGADTALDPIAFEVPEGTTQTRLEYRTTGHGGADDDSPTCIGPAEEFCRRTHTLWIDEEPRPGFIPWRDDCADLCTLTHYGPANAGFDYCLENPTGSIQSVQAPRANWCPGSETPPFVYDLDLAPGPHSFRYAVRAVKPGGSWRTSATAYFYGD